MENKPSQQCIYPNCDCENTPSGEVICKYYEDDSPSQQMPAEGERERHPLQDILDKENETGDWTTTKLIAALIIDRDNLKAELAHINGAPTTISPTELEREAEGWAKRNFIDVTLQPIAKYCYLAAAKRYTRQGGEDWEALYISEHLNLLTAKGRIAELEKQLALNK